MQKVDGVQTVRVSLKDGLTILDLKPGNSVTLATLRQIIKNNGFVSKEASVDASGRSDNSDTFIVNGTNERIAISRPPQLVGAEWRLSVPAPRP
jgi:hypothetical protein